MKRYMVASFALFTALAVVLTINWWMVFPDDLWPIRLAFVIVGVGMTLFGLFMTLVALGTEYR